MRLKTAAILRNQVKVKEKDLPCEAIRYKEKVSIDNIATF